MNPRGNYAWRGLLGLACAGCALAGILAGCGAQPAPKPVTRYESLPAKQVPAFLQGTVLERTDLLETDLFVLGADTGNPSGSVNVQARCEGPIFVNPAYALVAANSPAGRSSLRYGTVLDGGLVAEDRALILRLREPQRSMSRQIEMR